MPHADVDSTVGLCAHTSRTQETHFVHAVVIRIIHRHFHVKAHWAAALERVIAVNNEFLHFYVSLIRESSFFELSSAISEGICK